MEFREKTLAERIEILEKIRAVHKDRIPVLLYPTDKAELEALANEKMLVPADLSAGMLLSNLRRDLQLGDENSLFLFVSGNGKKGKLLRTGRP